MAVQLDSQKLVRVEGHPGVYRKGNRYVVVWRGQKHFCRNKTEAIKTKATFVIEDRKPAERVLFRDYAKRWLDNYQGRTSKPISASTRAQYRDVIERLALPFFGRRRLDDVRSTDVRKFIDQLGAELEPSTVRRYLAPVKALFATAKEEGLIRSNPADGVRITVQSKRDVHDLPEYITPAEYHQLIEEVPTQWQPVIRFVALTGMRIEETLNARWGDITQENGRTFLKVRKSKSEAGLRTIPVFSELATELAERRPANAGADDLIWTNRFGQKLDAHNLRFKVLKPAARRAGISAIAESYRGFHVLRHTVGSLLLERGWTLPQVSAFLGHADVGITARVYLHAIEPGDIEVLADTLSSEMKRSGGGARNGARHHPKPTETSRNENPANGNNPKPAETPEQFS